MTISAKEIVAEGAAAIDVDNSGFVYASYNGISKCEYIYTLAKFIQDMASGIGVDIKLFHTGRRTTMEERIADALSKGNMEEVRAEMH